MAVSETTKKISVNVILNTGTSNGVIQTASFSIGALSSSNYDAQKIMNIVNLLSDCLSKPVYSAEKVEVKTLTEDD